MDTDRLIKGLTIKQWWKIFSVPVLIAAYFALMSILCMDVVDGGVLAILVFVLSMCIGLYVASVKNLYHEWRGERMSRENMETEIKQLKEELRYCRGYAAKTRRDLDEVWMELEKTRMDIRRIDHREMVRDKE